MIVLAVTAHVCFLRYSTRAGNLSAQMTRAESSHSLRMQIAGGSSQLAGIKPGCNPNENGR
jgi:hypothetical protein